MIAGIAGGGRVERMVGKGIPGERTPASPVLVGRYWDRQAGATACRQHRGVGGLAVIDALDEPPVHDELADVRRIDAFRLEDLLDPLKITSRAVTMPVLEFLDFN